MFIWLSKGFAASLISLPAEYFHFFLDVLQYFPLIFPLFLYPCHQDLIDEFCPPVQNKMMGTSIINEFVVRLSLKEQITAILNNFDSPVLQDDKSTLNY